MSADFFSDVRVAPAEVCERWYAALAPLEHLADIVGPEEETLFSFGPDGDGPALAELSAAYERDDRQPPFELGPTYVELDFDRWSELFVEDDYPSATHMSSNYASVVALDRAVAIPRGVDFLAGRALRRVRHAELDGFVQRWRGLMQTCGGGTGVARLCRPWLDRGSFDAAELAELVDAIGTLAAQARAEKLDLFIVGYPVP